MDRIVITIRPTPSDEGLLRVADAMQQVIDAINLLEHAERALVAPQDAFEWRLERASTASPFTVVAVAEALNPAVDIAPQVRRLKAEVSSGLRNFIAHGTPPAWMDAEGVKVARNIFARNRNGISRTDIDFDPDSRARNVVSIDRRAAEAGIQAFAALNPLDIDGDLPQRVSFGEIEGVMVAAGRYRNRPAIQIRTELYGFVWGILAPAVISQFGTETSISEIWKGRTIGIRGRLSYASGGKLKQIDVIEIREIVSAPPIDLDSILDPEFTSGMDPNEYLDKLHAGELA
jgi:hypothetical protein